MNPNESTEPLVTKAEICPICGVIRNLKETTSIRPNSDGTKSIKVSSFHCEVCGGFVVSEETELES